MDYKPTTDTTLASYLITQGFRLTHIDYSQPRFAFLFEDTGQFAAHSARFTAGTALTDPTAFDRVNKKLLRIINKHCQWEED